MIEWETPQEFFNALDQEFHFTLDPCAKISNAKCKKFFTILEDGLSKSWCDETVWLNPPYDKSIGTWIKKAYENAQAGGLVVALIQGRSTDTKLWHDYVMKSSEIRFIKDRLHFGNNGKFARANISSVVVVFRPFCKGPPVTSSIDIKGKHHP
jgi:site-specific DNA-methyltransferase (adenine-specific)